jgi:hypothetical protein
MSAIPEEERHNEAVEAVVTRLPHPFAHNLYVRVFSPQRR